jgi:hypothetical protein
MDRGEIRCDGIRGIDLDEDRVPWRAIETL